MAESREEQKSWKKLLKEFSGNTTLHGCRIIGEDTLCIRRLIWAGLTLTCAVFFFWFMADRLVLLNKHTTAVNVEIIYNDTIDFPTVTVCNHNFFKKTAAHENGLYDLVHDTFVGLQRESHSGLDNATDADEEIAEGFEVTRDHYLSNLDTTYTKYVSVTASVCKRTCLEIDSDQCCSLVYIRATSTCYVTPLEYSDVSESRGLQVLPREGVDYYRRKKCQVQGEASCNFDGQWCSFIPDLASSLLWRIVAGSASTDNSRPAVDHTTMTLDKGMYLHASTISDDLNLQAVFLSTYILSFEETCIDFFYQIAGGVLEIRRGLRQDSAETIWHREKVESPNWEQGRVRSSAGYFRLFFVAAMLSASDNINIALDDVQVGPCQKALECKESAMALGYRGTRSYARSGRPCQPWKELSLDELPSAWQEDVRGESNYCRNPDADPNGPWCFTDTESGRVEYCDIPSCGCKGTAFQCNNDRCVGNHKRCNGADDCGDYSDETDCSPNANCAFEDGQNCSYSTWQESVLTWTYQETDAKNSGYMSLETTGARPGQTGTLSTPVGFFNSSVLGCLQFSLDIKSASLDVLYVRYPGSLWPVPLCSVPNVEADDGFRAVEMEFRIPDLGEFSNVLFRATVWSGENSWVRLDNIVFSRGACHQDVEIGTNSSDTETKSQIYEDSREQSTLQKRSVMQNVNIFKNEDEAHYDYVHHAPAPRSVRRSVTRATTTPTSRRSDSRDYLTPTTPSEFVEHPNDTTESSLRLNIFAATIGINISLGQSPIDLVCDGGEAECWTCPKRLMPSGCSTRNASAEECQTSTACIESEGITCSFRSECGCGYQFVSSNYNDVWHVADEDNATDLSFSDGAAVFTGNADVDDWTILSSPMQLVEDTSCLEFVYSNKYVNMHLLIYNQTTHEKLATLSLDGMERAWHKAQLTLRPGFYGVAFQFIFAGKGETALDNITLVKGPCYGEEARDGSVDCTFDDVNLCGYKDITENNTRQMWYRSKSYDEASPGGYFLRTTETAEGKETRDLLSPVFSTEYSSCLQFYYFMLSQPADDMATMSILLLNGSRDDGLVSVDTSAYRHFLWGVRGVSDSAWHLARAVVPPGDYYRLLLEVNGMGVRGGFDDISVLPRNCSVLVCSEEEYKCTSKEACIPLNHVRDGIKHCYGGEDELTSPCSNEGGSGDTCPSSSGEHEQEVEKRDTEGPKTQLSKAEEYVMDIHNAPKGNVTSVAEMYMRLGPGEDDFVHTCSWEGVPCKGTFTRRVTDYGLCYSFNYVSSSDYNKTTIDTAKTGSRYGLSLKLNIEQYEYMKGPYSDAGVKVYLHDFYEQPQVRDLGFAVAPGTHTLAGIRVNEAISLEPPWGECGTQPLKYFTDARYTYSNCIMQCEVDDLVGACKCRDAYMPAEQGSDLPLPCSIEEYFSCAVPHLYGLHGANTSDGINDADRAGNWSGWKDCPCRKACKEVLYEVSLSYASLSAFSVDQILSTDSGHLQERLDTALETSQRTNPDVFVADMEMFLAIPTMYEQHNKFLDTFAAVTSKDVWQATQTLGRLFVADINLLLGNTKRQLEVYKLCFDGTQNLLSNLMDTFESNVLFTEQLLYMSKIEGVRHSRLGKSLKDATSDIEIILQTLKLLLTKFSNASMAVDASVAVSQDDIELLPAKFFSDEMSCNSTAKDLASSLKSLDALYKDMDNKFEFEEVISADEMVELASRLSSNASIFIHLWAKSKQCFTEYRGLLEEALGVSAKIKSKAQKEVIELDSPITVDASMQKGISKMREDHIRFASAIQNYILNRLTKRELLASFVSVDGSQGQVHTHVSTLTNKIRTRMITPLSTILLSLKMDLQRVYLNAMEVATNLQGYLFPGYFYDRAVKMSIWQVPKADPDDPKSFTTEGRELWRIWDRDFPIGNFTKEKAPAIMTAALDSFVDPLQDELTNADAQLSLKNHDLVDVIEQVQDEYKAYELKRTIDHEFVLQNFLHLDIYFKQLKYQQVTQMKAYDIKQFWSDMGGILGLLLGCSVLSVFELVDFFIYNCLRKMHHGGSNKTWDCNGTKNDKLDKSPKVSLSPSVISNTQKPGFFDGSAYYGIDFAHV